MTINYHKSLKDKEALVIKYYKKIDLLSNHYDKFQSPLTNLKLKKSSKTKKKMNKPIINDDKFEKIDESSISIKEEESSDIKIIDKTKKAKKEYKPSDFIVED